MVDPVIQLKELAPPCSLISRNALRCLLDPPWFCSVKLSYTEAVLSITPIKTRTLAEFRFRSTRNETSDSLIFGSYLPSQYVQSKGIVSLDSLTFDKLLSKFKVSIVKFNAAYPYGHKHDVYTKFAESTYTVSDLLVGEVAVKDYGDKENEELMKRYNIKTEDFPVVKLFVEDVSEAYTFDAKEDNQFTYQSLYDFVKSKKTGLYLGCAGCLEQFDRLAEDFMQTSDAQERKKKLRLAEDLWDKITSMTEQKSAEIYVKSMRKVIEKSDDFVTKELERVDKLLKGKITKEKQDELQKRINILQSFKVIHDEL